MDGRYGRRYEDDERRSTEWAPREYDATRDQGEGYYAGRRGYGRRDRGFFDRAGDEVRSWFGDEEAERRRRDDERRARWRGESSTGWGEWASGSRERDEGRQPGGSADVDERAWARQWGYVDEPHGRRPSARQREERWSERFADGPRLRDDFWIPAGPYSGRGPRGYQRSDERIREDVCDLLCEHGALDASNVEVQVAGREVTLVGFVPTRFQKRLAEDLADSVTGVSEVHNQLRVTQLAASTPPAAPAPPPGVQDWRNRAA